MSLNAANRKDIREAEKRQKLAEQNRREVLVQIMSTVNGREWIWNRLSAANIFSVAPPTDALMMAFREGERNQGVQLLDDVMQSCPKEFIQAMEEANGRRTADTARTSPGSEHSRGENLDGGVEASNVDRTGETGYDGYVHDLRDEKLN